MKIYLSLPISNLPIEQVRNKADLIKTYLSKSGQTVVSPFDIYAGENPTYEDHLAEDIRQLLNCDAIYLCKGWNMSCGCSIEHDIALSIKKFRNPDFKILLEQ